MDVVVLGETIDEILKRISSLSTAGFGFSTGDTTDLRIYLQVIQEVVHREEENHVHGEVLIKWLRELKTVVNDLIDLLEEISTDASNQEEETRLPFLKHNPFKNRAKVINTKVKKVLEELQNVASKLPMSEDEAREKKLETKLTKLDLEIYKSLEPIGREKEKKAIIDQLIIIPRTKIGEIDVVPIPVVTIVGFAGIGKTKLARLICGDERVKSHFGSQIWVELHESKTFDVESIFNDSPTTDRRGGCLVVLDGVRTEIGEKDLLKLQRMLRGLGGAILITTRSKLVANKITANIRGNLAINHNNVALAAVRLHVLQGLNEEDSWSLFCRIRGQSSKEAERKIVMDCGGVPLWIIITTTFVNNCGTKEEDAALKEMFLQELKFRYYDTLPRLQKLCFAFCSLFPRDHLIDVERLIRIGMAEGFLMESSMGKSTEELFRGYFNDFIGRPIFKDMEEDDRGLVRRCRMQPLMHDLARFVGDHVENIIVDPEGEKVHKGVLRASFDFSLDVSRGIPDSLFEKAKKLRAILLWKTHTLLPKEMKTSTSTCDKIFKTFKGLRMLDLHGMGIKMLTSSIGELKNVRYLDLSLNKIEKLPGSITKLFNLQTLKLSQCYLLKELPKNIEDLINLRHLEIEGCLALTHMPRKIHKLSYLQTLSLFMVSEGYHLGGLGELASLNLNNLRGHLEILHLERLKLKLSITKDNCLKGKKHLQCLTLRWGHEEDIEEETDKDKNTLDCLEPHPESELRALLIVGYKSSTLSTWISSIQRLVKISLYDCTNCKILPQLDQLPNLRFLELLRMNNLEFIAEKDEKGKSPVVFFPSLEELTISDCPKLKSWWKINKTTNDILFFPCISKLHVYYCPELTHMPLYPGLDEELILVGSSVKPLVETIVNGRRRCYQFSKLKSMKIASIEDNRSPPEHWLECFSSLEKLDIREWKHLESLPKGFDHLSSLQHLNIENCHELDLDLSNIEWEGLKNLCSLTIRENPKLKSLPLGVDKVTSIQDLELHNCPKMTFLPESIANLKSLGRLVISKCNKLAWLPKGLKDVESLHTLIILDCPLLLARCQPNTGDDWPQISHIKNIQVMETSQDI